LFWGGERSSSNNTQPELGEEVWCRMGRLSLPTPVNVINAKGDRGTARARKAADTEVPRGRGRGPGGWSG